MQNDEGIKCPVVLMYCFGNFGPAICVNRRAVQQLLEFMDDCSRVRSKRYLKKRVDIVEPGQEEL